LDVEKTRVIRWPDKRWSVIEVGGPRPVFLSTAGEINVVCGKCGTLLVERCPRGFTVLPTLFCLTCRSYSRWPRMRDD
jgi:hypothetical protein